jgi:hypothetical protein
MNEKTNHRSGHGFWEPLAPEKLNRIRHLFSDLFPAAENGNLAERISDYWITRLKRTWMNKPDAIRRKDRSYRPSDPLSRISRKTLVIVYADSVFENNETTLTTLDKFLGKYFPAAGGLHILPACRVVENRFNDGYFSQVVRDQIHPKFGTNQQFSHMMEKYFSMADFVLNHVDIENPRFQSYLNGDDRSGNCFFVFSETEYQKRLADGDFDRIFRPRPFPLFTIFRRKPKEPHFAKMSAADRMAAINHYLAPGRLPEAAIGLLSIFNKIQNDQMLLETDNVHISEFLKYLNQHTTISPDDVFTLSETQETRHPPYIFQKHIRTKADLLKAIGYDTDTAKQYAAIFEKKERDIFGEEIRALTTFSHVQADLNTATFEGLQLLCDDFSWYLSMDLNMLRLDAANYAFKRWKTTCFGLPEVRRLMQILYLSMDVVAPRTVANLEVNDRLSAILSQIADPDGPPPMMYDFHLASLLPAVFNSQNTDIAARIFDLIQSYDIPKTTIRFSVADTHDGKSVRGSLDLLTPAERQSLVQIVEKNGGKIKSKGVRPRQYAKSEFNDVCACAALDQYDAAACLFTQRPAATDFFTLKETLFDESDIARALKIDRRHLDTNAALTLFCQAVIHGREPYEICASTRDTLIKVDDPTLEAKRFLAFYTMAFALMGRHVKSVYFNDLMGLGNDYDRMATTGELRDIKRTKSSYARLEKMLNQPDGFHAQVATGMNQLIAVADADPALHFRGSEAAMRSTGNPKTACIHNHWRTHHSFTLVNTSGKTQAVSVDLSGIGGEFGQTFIDRFAGQSFDLTENILAFDLKPYERLWLKPDRMTEAF